MNTWQKANRLERESTNCTKESMIQRFKQKGRFWDFVEERSWLFNNSFRTAKKYYTAVARQSIGKSFSSFCFKIRNSESYRSNRYHKERFEEWMKDLDQGHRSYYMLEDVFLDENNILRGEVPFKKGRHKWVMPESRKYPNIDCEFDRYGYPILFKNGIHYTKSFTYREKKFHSEYLGTDPETKKSIWHNWYTMEPVWQQLNAKDLRALALTNKL